ncbi:MAG: hypothetical protein AAGH70_00395 [Pseudomonadota bacterium]
MLGYGHGIAGGAQGALNEAGMTTVEIVRIVASTTSGAATEGATLTVSGDARWTVDGTEATPEAREYRLLLAGQPPATSSDPAISFATGTAGLTYAVAERALFAGHWSGWEPVTGGTVAAMAAQPHTMALAGATMTVTHVSGHGLHADGTPWVAVLPEAEIIETTPRCEPVTRDGDFPDAPLTALSHGLEYRPGRALGQGTLAQMQATNDRGTGDQGFDAVVIGSSNLPYNDARNVDPAVTGPRAATPGVYVKAVSKLSGIDAAARPAVDEMVPFTIYADGAAPTGDVFRPGFASDGAALSFGPADLDTSVLGNVDVSGYAGALPDFTEAMALISNRIATHQRCFNVLERNIVSEDVSASIPGFLANDVYAGFHYQSVAVIALLCNTTHFTEPQKRALLANIVQQAVDVAARAEQGGVWEDAGGQCHGVLEIVAMAARLTGAPLFAGALPLTTETRNFAPGPAPIWGTLRQIFEITQADIDRPKIHPYTADMLGYPEWSGDATRDDPATTPERQNTLGVPADPATGNNGYYRHIIAKAGAAFSLALQLMGARTLFGSELWFDYQDRHMGARLGIGGPLPDGAANDVDSFTLWAWEEFRAMLGSVWAPAAPPAQVTRVARIEGEEWRGIDGTHSVDLSGLDLAPGDLVLAVANISGITNRSMDFVTPGYTSTGSIFVNDTNDVNAVIGVKVMGATPDTEVTFSHAGASTEGAVAVVEVYRSGSGACMLEGAILTATATNTTEADPPTLTPSTPGARIVVGACAAHADSAGAAYGQGPFTDLSQTVGSGTAREATVAIGNTVWSGTGAFEAPPFTMARDTTSDSALAFALAIVPA